MEADFETAASPGVRGDHDIPQAASMAALMYMNNAHSLTFVFGSFAKDAHCLKNELYLSTLAVFSAAALTMAAALYFYLRGQRTGSGGKADRGLAQRPLSFSSTTNKAESSMSPAAAAATAAVTDDVSDADVMGCDATLCGVVELLAAAVVFFGARAAEQAACGGLSKMVSDVTGRDSCIVLATSSHAFRTLVS